MSLKESIDLLKNGKYDNFRTEVKKSLMEKAIEKIEERKVVVAKNYLK